MNEVEAQRAPPLWDAPNQQVVRPDHSGPGTPPNGTGGSSSGTTQALTLDGAESSDYGSMTKADLIALAQERGISPANNDMTKDELVGALEQG